MATRFSFGQVITSPAFAFSATWSAAGSTPVRLLARTSKRKAIASGAPLVNTSSETTASILNKQSVQLIAKLGAAQTITGTVKGYALFSESDAAQDCRVQCEFRIIGEDGTVRGTLLAADAGALSSEFVATATNRRIPLLAATNTLTSVNAQAGDYLVMEIGHRTHVASGTSYNVTLQWHDDPATGDLPEDETTTTTTLAPWIEFSQTLILSTAFDQLTGDVPTTVGIPAIAALPQDNATATSVDTLLEFSTQGIAMPLVDRQANKAADDTANIYTPLLFTGDVLALPFDDNHVEQFGNAAPGIGVVTPLPQDIVPSNRSTSALADFQLTNTNIAYELIDPTNRDIDVSSLGAAGAIYYTNRVYDTIAVGFVKWITTRPDDIGASYPGPGTFGVSTSDYVVERRSVI